MVPSPPMADKGRPTPSFLGADFGDFMLRRTCFRLAGFRAAAFRFTGFRSFGFLADFFFLGMFLWVSVDADETAAAGRSFPGLTSYRLERGQLKRQNSTG